MGAIKILAETADTVTISRADLDALIAAEEDAQDLAAIRAHRAHEEAVGWETARASYLTTEEAQRLLDGESPVRVWREKRGMTQRALAEAAEISVPYLCEIESGKKPGSAQALYRLARILQVRMEDLLPVESAD